MQNNLPPSGTRATANRHRRNRHHFLFAALRTPLKIGGFLPSSRGLAKAMASGVDITRPGAIIELGAGTGVVTNALLKAGIPTNRLLVIERNEKLHALISSHFPHVKILQADAMHLDKVLASEGISAINAIVSSLPFLVMPKEVREAIQHHMATVIGTDGIIIQFTYGPASPISQSVMRQCGLQGQRMKIVVSNLPPAHVWVYRRIRECL